VHEPDRQQTALPPGYAAVERRENAPLNGELLRQRLVRRRKNARRPTIRWSLASPRRLIPSSGNRRREAQLAVIRERNL
jgi:hypothetical protein